MDKDLYKSHQRTVSSITCIRVNINESIGEMVINGAEEKNKDND